VSRVKTIRLALALSLLLAAPALSGVTLKYQVKLTPQNAKEFLGALVLALFFVADDQLTWEEDDAGRVTLENAGKALMKIDPPAGQVSFLSLFEKRFVPVEAARAEQVLALTAFYRRNPHVKGDEIELDYPLRGKKYRVRAAVASFGRLQLGAWPGEALPCAKIEGLITGWGDDKKTTFYAYVGREGELARKILKLSFKFTDWPRVTMTLCGLGGQ
jgi:hypothetical protein